MSGTAEVNAFTRPTEIHWAIYYVYTVLRTRDVAANKTHKIPALTEPTFSFLPA